MVNQCLENYLHAELKYLNFNNINLKYNKFQKEVYIEETVELNHAYPAVSILIYLLDMKSIIFLLMEPFFEAEFRKIYYSSQRVNHNKELVADVLSKKLFKITEIYLNLAAKLTKIRDRAYSNFWAFTIMCYFMFTLYIFLFHSYLNADEWNPN